MRSVGTPNDKLFFVLSPSEERDSEPLLKRQKPTMILGETPNSQSQIPCPDMHFINEWGCMGQEKNSLYSRLINQL